jgi:hypothetical protein
LNAGAPTPQQRTIGWLALALIAILYYASLKIFD